LFADALGPTGELLPRVLLPSSQEVAAPPDESQHPHALVRDAVDEPEALHEDLSDSLVTELRTTRPRSANCRRELLAALISCAKADA
jgi:hypothetical protein